MHLLHDFKATYAKLGLFIVVAILMTSQICNAQSRSRVTLSRDITIKDALHWIEKGQKAPILWKLRTLSAPKQLAQIAFAAIKFIRSVAGYTEISNFETKKIIYSYDPVKDEGKFLLSENVASFTHFDPNSSSPQKTPFDHLWDRENGKYSDDAETADGISLNTLTYVKEIIQKVRSQPQELAQEEVPLALTLSECSLDFDHMAADLKQSPLLGPQLN